MSRVLAIGDTHFPWVHPDYLAFLKDTQKRFRCDTVIHCGDEWDQAGLSRFDKDPDGVSPAEEYRQALEISKVWYKAFPRVGVLESNHGIRPFKKAFSAGIPTAYLRGYKDYMKAPAGWEWFPRLIVDNVLYFHGEPFGGENAASNASKQHRMSCVIGHVHAYAGVRYAKSFRDEIFGLNVGCGIDESAPAFNYAKDNARRPSIGCGVIIDGREAFYVPMQT